MTQPTLEQGMPAIEYAADLDSRLTQAIGAMEKATRDKDRPLRFWEAYQSICGGGLEFQGQLNMGDIVTAIRNEARDRCKALLVWLEYDSQAYRAKKETPEYLAFAGVFRKSQEQIVRFNREMAERVENFRLGEARLAPQRG